MKLRNGCHTVLCWGLIRLSAKGLWRTDETTSDSINIITHSLPICNRQKYWAEDKEEEVCPTYCYDTVKILFPSAFIYKCAKLIRESCCPCAWHKFIVYYFHCLTSANVLHIWEPSTPLRTACKKNIGNVQGRESECGFTCRTCPQYCWHMGSNGCGI